MAKFTLSVSPKVRLFVDSVLAIKLPVSFNTVLDTAILPLFRLTVSVPSTMVTLPVRFPAKAKLCMPGPEVILVFAEPPALLVPLSITLPFTLTASKMLTVSSPPKANKAPNGKPAVFIAPLIILIVSSPLSPAVPISLRLQAVYATGTSLISQTKETEANTVGRKQ